MPRKPADPGRKPGSRKQPSAQAGGWLRKHGVAVALVVAALSFVSIWYWPHEVTASAKAAPRGSSGAAFLQTPGRPDGLPALAPLPTREQRLQELSKQLELADHSLCSYKNASKYPSSSRSIKEHPDQVYPNQPILEKNALRKEGGGTDAAIQIMTSQSRVYLAAGEAAAFSIQAVDSEGRTQPLFITRAVARGITYQGSREMPQLVLPFTDDGSNGDAAAGDGIFSGSLAPALSGFANFSGTIRVEVKYNVGDRSGVVLFDVIYSPETPATWAGGAREAVENGALNFYLKAVIHTPGRYVVTGRVDDARGKPFALATFNDVLGQGPNEVRLTVYGKLLRDEQPALPLTLRDVDGYLLKENTDPDRALMPRIAGTAYVSKTYPLKTFSDAEWQSEERTRYLTEFGKDVALAKAALVEFNPEQAQQPFPRSECTAELEAKDKAH
ncbi:MAG: choice-of-anchor X domain-containing protein [Pseudomonadota bacterium]